jgi:hypothetical protein
MTNNTPDYTDNLYFEEKKMTDCKNCPYTDEYCASGDCERNADVSKTLTEQWKKGELPEGVYYCNTGNTVETLFTWGKNYHQLTNNKDEVYIHEMDDCDIIAPVPSYDEWKEMVESEAKSHLQADSYYNKILELKDLLKQSRIYVKIETEDYDDRTVSKADKEEAKKLLKQIDEVLK